MQRTAAPGGVESGAAWADRALDSAGAAASFNLMQRGASYAARHNASGPANAVIAGGSQGAIPLYGCLPIDAERIAYLLGFRFTAFTLQLCVAPDFDPEPLHPRSHGGPTFDDVQRALLDKVALRYQIASKFVSNALMAGYASPLLDDRLADAGAGCRMAKEAYMGMLLDAPSLHEGSVIDIVPRSSGVGIIIDGQDLGLVPCAALGRAQLGVYFDGDAALPEWRGEVLAALAADGLRAVSQAPPKVIEQDPGAAQPGRGRGWLAACMFGLVISCCCGYWSLRSDEK